MKRKNYPFWRTYQRHGHIAIARTVARGCGRLGNGKERKERERKGKKRKGKDGKGRERKGKDGKGRKGRERKGEVDLESSRRRMTVLK